MGLDIVELIVTVENKFGISLSNSECEQVYTIQDLADVLYKNVKVTPSQMCLSQTVFYRIRNVFEQLGNKIIKITPNTKILQLLNKDDLVKDWKLLEHKIGLKIPDLVDLDVNSSLNEQVRFLGFKIFDRTAPVTDNTLGKLIDWVISMNYEELISLNNISSKYEIERIVCGITEDRSGVPLTEIELNHSFTYDLGMN